MTTSIYTDGYAPREYLPAMETERWQTTGLLMEEPQRYDGYPGERVIQRYADILNDTCFKKILGAERNKDALIEILRLLIPGRDIRDILYSRKKRKRNPFADGHDAVFDVECIDADGTRFVVEMQRWEQENFYDRVLFYSTFPVQEQVPVVKKDENVPHDRQYKYRPVYVVSLMAFSLHPEEDEKLLYRFDLRESDTGERMSDKLNFVFLEMNKVKAAPAMEAPILEKLSWAMMNMGILKSRPAALVEKVFEKLFKACELDAYEQEERTQIIEAMTTERDKRNIAYTYWMKGKNEGREEGREEGRAEERLQTAKKLLKMGLPVEQVAEGTGLTVEQIREL